MTDGAPILPPPPEQQAQKVVRVLPPVGELVAEPRFAGVGESALVRGEGLVPGKDYKLNWTRVVGNRMMGPGAEQPGRTNWEELSKVVAEGKADANGKVAFRFPTPDDLGGTHGLWIDNGSARKFGSFYVKPTALPVDVTRGPASTTFTIHRKGGGWTETANIYHVVYDNNYTGYVCAFNSQGDVEIFMKATGAPGVHFIDLYPGIYKGTETRPNNFRIPQLTYADDHPGEDRRPSTSRSRSRPAISGRNWRSSSGATRTGFAGGATASVYPMRLAALRFQWRHCRPRGADYQRPVSAGHDGQKNRRCVAPVFLIVIEGAGRKRRNLPMRPPPSRPPARNCGPWRLHRDRRTRSPRPPHCRRGGIQPS